MRTSALRSRSMFMVFVMYSAHSSTLRLRSVKSRCGRFWQLSTISPVSLSMYTRLVPSVNTAVRATSAVAAAR